MSKRTDENQQAIINCFRQLGYTVLDLHEVGGGCPDIEVAKHGDNDLIEIKTEKGKLNDLQLKFAQMWNAPVYIIRSVDNVIRFDSGGKYEFQIK